MNTTIHIEQLKWSIFKSNIKVFHIKEVDDKDPKFKVGDHIRISKYKNIFVKGYTPNCSELVFVIKGVKILFHGHVLLTISMVKKLLEHFIKRTTKKKSTFKSCEKKR